MPRFGTEAKIGVAIILAIIILIYGIVYLQELPVRKEGHTIKMIFKNVTGLGRGDAVTVAGFKVGHVLKLRLVENSVEVNAWVGSEANLPKDSRAYLKSLGVVGEKYIELVPGNSDQTIQDGDTLRGGYQEDIAEVSSSVSGAINQATAVLARLRSVLDSTLNNKAQSNIGESITNVKSMTDGLNRVIEKNSREIDAVVSNLKVVSANLKDLSGSQKEAVQSSIKNFEESSNRLKEVSSKLEKSSDSLNSILSKIENEEGTLGKLVNDKELYDALHKTVRDVDDLVVDLKKNPKKYVGVTFKLF